MIQMDGRYGHQAQSSPYPSLYHKRNISSGSLKKMNSFHGTSMQVEVMEVKQTTPDAGLYYCLLEIFDGKSEKPVWKQKTSQQSSTKGTLFFQDLFKVKSFQGDLDVKPGSTVKVSLMDNAKEIVDTATVKLGGLALNKNQEETIKTDNDKAHIVLRFYLANTHYPRSETHYLRDLDTEKPHAKLSSSATSPRDHTMMVPLPQSNEPLYTLPRVNVKFCVNYHTQIGEQLRVVGSNYKLGDWDVNQAPVMNWMGDGRWELEVSFRKAYIPFEYKYVVFNTHNHCTRWEETPNRRVEDKGSFVGLSDKWEHS